MKWVNSLLLWCLLSVTLQAAEVLNMAPDFTLAEPLGKIHTLAEYKGKPLILHFWATWCPYCKKLQPGLESIANTYKNTDLQLVGISFNENEGAMPGQTLKKRGIHFPTLVKGESVAKDYGVPGTPTTVFINRAGEIMWVTNISDPHDPSLNAAAEFILKK
ncbi:TlpA family protein disulfide reductase [Shewanella sp. VB17]|uniref:peroxiredoxin family protein n=1 Tax=Shewanella sp. VB17 TaxID=2739432 RepID=UPI00156552AD|nr:TlpA disulfide reductase family protein [Shewanella sp. VB17]NRD73301.1 TlpA family protein disulfide reductase [Shewanella sp. VB17]